MKKNKMYFIGVLVCTVLTLAACAKAKEDRCSELETKMTDAGTAFGNNMSEATCNDYINAIQDYYDGCDNIPASVRATYDSYLDNYDCSIFGK
jgi:hypothetical protein